MLKEVFEKDFYRSYPKRENTVVNVVENVYSAQFSLSDPKSCESGKGTSACKLYDTCDHVNLWVHSDEPVHVVSMDNVLEYLKNPLPHNADYVLCSKEKIRVVEMTCMEELYVETGSKTYSHGKRAHAQSQCEKLLLMLHSCGPIRIFVEHHAQKEAIFSWRRTDEPVVLENSMAYFDTMQREVERTISTLPMSFGFRFRELRYPEILEW